MKTFNRICIKDLKIEAEDGGVFEIKRGKEYITSEEGKNKKVVVFSNYWVPVSIKHFAGAEKFTD